MITSRLPRMHPRLAELLDYLDAARARVLGEAARLPRDRWGIRPEPDRWSVAEVVLHLQRLERGIAKVIAQRLGEVRASGHPTESDKGSMMPSLVGRHLAHLTFPFAAPPRL